MAMESTPARDLDWRSRLRLRHRQHPVWIKIQYVCLLFASVSLAVYATIVLG